MRLNALDLVRFFAAISVVMYHYTASSESNSPDIIVGVTQFGYLGVPLFFILSGYVISYLLKTGLHWNLALLDLFDCIQHFGYV